MSASQPLDFLLTWYIMFIKQFAVRKHKTAIRLLADGFGGLCFHRADARERKGLSSFERALRNLKTAIRLLADGFGGLCFHRADAREQKGLSSFERALRNRKAAIQPLADGICGRRNNVI